MDVAVRVMIVNERHMIPRLVIGSGDKRCSHMSARVQRGAGVDFFGKNDGELMGCLPDLWLIQSITSPWVPIRSSIPSPHRQSRSARWARPASPTWHLLQPGAWMHHLILGECQLGTAARQPGAQNMVPCVDGGERDPPRYCVLQRSSEQGAADAAAARGR